MVPFIGSFATQYFSHLFDLSRFAAMLFFAVVRQLTINYSLTTGIHQSLLIRSVIRTFNIDFFQHVWILTALSILSYCSITCILNYGKKKKNLIVYTAYRRWGGGGELKYGIDIYVPHRFQKWGA